MTKRNRESLRQFFKTGNTPTEGQFADLIDSGLNQLDDSVTSDPNGLVGIGAPAPAANLTVRGRLFTPLTGTVSLAAGSTALVGTGTSFVSEIAVGDAISVGQQVFTVAAVSSATNAVLSPASASAANAATAFRDVSLLLVENGGGDAQLVVDKSGNVGVGVASPGAKLHVGGKLLASELAGDGGGLTNLQASQLAGQVALAQIPDVPAQKITGQLSPAQLPPGGDGNGVIKGRLDKALTGTVSTLGTSPSVTGAGTLFTKELKPGYALKIGAEIFTVSTVADDQHLQLDRNPAQAATSATAFRDGELLSIQAGDAAPRLTVGEEGTLSWPLRQNKVARVGTRIGLDPGNTIAVAAPRGFLHCTDDDQWCLVWQPGGAVTVRGLLKTFGDFDLRGSLGIGSPAASGASLSVKGRTSVALTGTVTASKSSAVVQGDGTRFLDELKPGYVIQFDNTPHAVVSVEDATHLTIDRPHFADVSNLPAQTNGPLVRITDPLGANQFSIDAAGNVAVGAAPRYTKLSVVGGVSATDLAGSGAGITNLKASNIEGTLAPAQIPALTVAQIPDLPASKITEGQLDLNRIPTLDASHIPTLNASHIPTLDASKITGQLKPEQIPGMPSAAWVARLQQTLSVGDNGWVGIGTPQPAARLEIAGSGTETVLSAGAASGSKCDVRLAGHVQLRQYGDSKLAYLQARDDADPSAIGLVLRVQQAGAAGKERYREAITINDGGNVGIGVAPTDARLQVPGILRADQIQGSGAGITDISAANVKGVFAPEQLPSLDASKIKGQLGPGQLPPITAAGISGQLSVDQIPNLPASKIIGQGGGPAGVGPGGRPLLATGQVALGATQTIYNIPVPGAIWVPACYSLEIYTMVIWSDESPMPRGGVQVNQHYVMTRTILAGVVYNVTNTMWQAQAEPMNAGPTQTNHPESQYPTVSYTVAGLNRQAVSVQMQTTKGNSTYPGNTNPVIYYIYSLL